MVTQYWFKEGAECVICSTDGIVSCTISLNLLMLNYVFVIVLFLKRKGSLDDWFFITLQHNKATQHQFINRGCNCRLLDLSNIKDTNINK